jgi:O-acetylserine/cysteine efflux transporter
MTLKHTIYAFVVALIWGSNFISIKMALIDLPPFLCVMLRFILSSFPFVFFIPRPKVSWRFMFEISIFLWIGQFSLLFLGIYMGMSPGLAALVQQCQAVFTIILAAVIYGCRPSPAQLLGIVLAVSGIAIIATQAGGNGNLIACILVIAAALSVSVANLMFKRMENINILSLIVWTSLIPPIPMFCLSLLFEGWDQIVYSLGHISLQTYGALFYTAWLSTLVATTLWGGLMRSYNPSCVVPFGLMVPVVAMSTSAIFLQEIFTLVDLIASTIIIFGLIVNQLNFSWRRAQMPQQLNAIEDDKKAA